MGYYDDDDYIDDDDYYDDDYEIDDDDEELGVSNRSSAINPFSSSDRGSGSSSGFPKTRPYSGSSPYSSGGGSRDRGRDRDVLSSRLDRSLGGDADDEDSEDRPRPFGGGRGLPGGSRYSGGSRFGSSGSSPPSSRDERSSDRQRTSYSGGSSGSPRTVGGKPARDDDDRRSSDRTRSSYGSGNRLGGSGGRFGSSSPSPPSTREREDDKGSSRFGANRDSKPTDSRSDDKKPEDKGGSSSSGIRSRFNRGGGDQADKKDDKKPADKPDKKGDASGGGITGALGGITGRLPGRGGDKSEKKDDKKPQSKGDDKSGSSGGGITGALGGITGRLPGRGGDKSEKKDDKKPAAKSADKDGSSGGRFGALRSRLPGGGGDKGEKQNDNKPESKPASGGRGAQSAFGQSKSGGAGGSKPNRPDKKARTAASNKPGKQSSTKKEAAAASKSSEGGLFSRISSALPFTGGESGDKKKSRTSKTRASKVPQSASEGLSLDTKLDILGVGLVFGALILFMSSLSGQQGAVTGWINGQVTQLLGWGAAGVPIAMAAVGIWLIIRHFGEEPPEVDPVRIGGLAMLYVGLLVLFMSIETFLNPIYQNVTMDLFPAFINTSVELGQGGGLIGAEAYLFLVQAIGEPGAVISIIAWLFISIMLATRTSAAEVAVFVISIWRSFQVAVERRAQRRRALRLEAEQRAAEERAAQISVAKPAAGELSAGSSAALPAPAEKGEAIEERPIPIRMGGQMVSAGAAQEPQPQRVAASSAPSDGSSSDSGGLFSRLKGALPFSADNGEQQAEALPATTTASTAPAAGPPPAAPPAEPQQVPQQRPAAQHQPVSEQTQAANTSARPDPAAAAPDNVEGSLPGGRMSRLDQIRAGQAALRKEAVANGGTQQEAVAQHAPPAESPASNGDVSPPPAQERTYSAFRRPADEPTEKSTPPAETAAPAEPVINRPQPVQPTSTPPTNRSRKEWKLPEIRSLLASGSEQDFDREMLVRRARIIEETLQSFGAPGRVVEINTGPVITQFGVEPDYLTARGGKKSRVKVSAIAQLDKDLQLALGAKSIRIEAPVPGKGYVGVEVPNEEASLVSLRDVMEAPQFAKIKSPLAIALGQSVDGAPIAADLAQMPHLLIAGTTGSGKSVCVNSVITSLLLRNRPDEVKFIMVDPKRVELTGYNGIPHLVAPVVVELERIVGVLKWVTREMDERYKKFSNAGARNIEDYNKHRDPNVERMPYIVVIIDELADLMMLAPEETERVITRIAALARATGIHLVIATQRPSVDVVTGLIKANFPARIAFAVAGGVDSRVILDQPGAERLLGKGDMLYLSGDSPAPLRLQGVYVSDMEINNINRFWKSQNTDAGPQKPITKMMTDEDAVTEARPVIPKGERFVQSPPASTQQPSGQQAFWEREAPIEHSAGYGTTSVDEEEHEDELYGEAVELVRRLNKASVSLLQRRLRIGYTRAARLIDVMEAEGVVGPPTEGSKPREVLPFK